jgi:hypothetical protein
VDVPQIEAALAELADRLTAPLPGECLHCYLSRVLPDLGCTGLRFTGRWSGSARRPEVLRWADGHADCDCEVLLLAPRSPQRERWTCPAALAELQAGEQGW